MSHRLLLTTIVLFGFNLATAEQPTGDGAVEPSKISYYKQIRPIFQAHCQGCHQPAKSSGNYVMTLFDKLVAGGESGDAAIISGKPDQSYLIGLVTPKDGKAEMPKGKKPLADVEIELIRKWIEEGAADDTPENAKQRYDKDHPPIYTMAPVITSVDYSPDGDLLAIAGFHEVLLHKSDGSGLVARLVGVSERIESVKFSPDGKRLLVTGGLPARMGEIQVWDVTEQKLTLSVPITYDTLYGGSWSPDGKLIAFGCSDNTLRAIDAETAAQVLFQGAHNDWVRDTVFSVDGSHLVSVSRDMTVKLTEVATERFIDNVTSITPGALKGGVTSVARHPERDEIVVGSADGVPKVYRLFRLTARRIGDDANLVKQLPSMNGRVFGVAVSKDGKRIAACSSLDGRGEISVYSYDFNTKLPDDVKKIMSKTVQQRNEAENKKLEQYWTVDTKLLGKADVGAGVFTVAFHPDGNTVAAAGGDGMIRLVDATTGEIQKEFASAPLSDKMGTQDTIVVFQQTKHDEVATETLEDVKVVKLEVEPAAIQFTGRFDYAQLLVTAVLDSGQRVDVTRTATRSLNSDVISISQRGLVKPKTAGDAALTLAIAGQSIAVSVSVSGLEVEFKPDFVRDVNPVISKLGCNAGTCHGSAQGKNGFKLSLRGYDPIFDVRSFTDDLASRRANIASPDDSLMLLKATGAVPHVGGQLFRPGEEYYSLVRDWIGSGAKLDQSAPRVASIDVSPKNPVIQREGSKQQIRVLATYGDGRVKDVTREAFIESGEKEIAEHDSAGLITAVRRGEAPILARFEGAYAATTLTVMGNRDEFTWQEPEKWGRIDELTAIKWQRMKIQPSELCGDAEFLRRVYLDLTGLPPTTNDVQAFLADERPAIVKRSELIDKLVGNDDYVEYWTNKWADLLQVNGKFLGPEGAAAFRAWIRQEVKSNTPYDEFVQKIVTASGSNKENPAASYFKILREPADTMENTTHLFLGVRFNCNKCHDHPFERWTQDQYYQTAAYFAQFGLKADPASGDKKIGGTAVEGAKPFYEIVFDKKDGEITHDRTQAVTPPEFPYECSFETSAEASRRERLAAWITSPDNQYFARSYVNRLWGYMFGVGIIEPIDDIRAGNPPSNPELLDYLTEEFIKSNFNPRHVIALICKSRTYQLSIETNRWNADDKKNYSHALARRLPAEVLYDAVNTVTGAKSNFPGVPPGTRAAALPDAGVNLPSGFLTTLGRPPRESACECERSGGLELGPVMALVTGPVIAEAIADPKNDLTRLVAEEKDDTKMIEAIFLRVLNRPVTKEEVQATIDAMNAIEGDHQSLLAAMKDRETFWATRKPELEKEREAAIAAANADLAAFEKQIAPKVAELEKQRQERIQQADEVLKAYQADLLTKHLVEWLKKSNKPVAWQSLDAASLTAVKGIMLEKQDDLSILAKGKANQGAYTITVNTDIQGITGFRVEAMPVAELKGGGPGLPQNGNFVVTEFEIQAATKSKPNQFNKVELHQAKADFLQDGFNIALAVDNIPGNQNAWAVANAGGVVHWATFETKQPLGFDEGTVLKIVIHHNHSAKEHLLAHFRVSATTAPPEIGLSLPESLQAALDVAEDQRTEEHKKLLTTYFEKSDNGLQAKQMALANAKQPVPVDSGVVQRKSTLDYVSKPIPDDAILVRLRGDVEMSKTQLANKRLTAAQDLAWALINSPAFLFNH